MRDIIVILGLVLFFAALFLSTASGASLEDSVLRASVVLLICLITGFLLTPLFLKVWHYPKTNTDSVGEGSEAAEKGM